MSFFLFAGYLLNAQNFQYPATDKRPLTDTYFGKTVTDDYRWLEDVNSEEVKNWLKAQGDYTNNWLEKIPGRNALIEDFKKFDALRPATINGIKREANRYFYKKTLSGESIGKIYYRNGKDGKEMLLFDPSTYKRGKNFSVSYFIPSRDGKKIALGLAEGGAEISTIRVFNVDTKKFYPESIYPSWFGVSGWTGDNKGFIYTNQKSGDKNSMDMLMDASAMYHVVGTQPTNDKLIFSREHNPDLGIKPEDICFVYYSEDYKYIIGALGGVNQDGNLFYAPADRLLKEDIKWKRLIQSEDSVVNTVIYDDKVFLLSHNGASKFKVLVSSLNDLDVKNAKTALPEGDQTIVYITRSKDYLFIIKSDGINNHIDQFNFITGKIEPVKLPINGTSDMYPLDVETNDCILFTTSWKQPTTIYDYNTTTQNTNLSSFNIPVKYPGIDELVVEEVEVPGHDGVMIPLSIIYNKKIKKDGSNVCYMTGYGAYGFSGVPYFSTLHLAMLNRGW